jgi:hypothetical protein
MLITSILLAILMLAIWGLYGTFSSLYEMGYVETERAQLVRSLLQQLTEDLAHTVSPPAAIQRQEQPVVETGESLDFEADFPIATGSTTASYASCADRIGLLGTHNSLRLDILQPEPPLGEVDSTLEDYAAAPEATAPRGGELVTVVYSFTPPITAGDRLPSQPGLKRKETRVNESLAQSIPETDAAMVSSADDTFLANPFPEPRPDELPLSVRSAMDSPKRNDRVRANTLDLPEVATMNFRYYDGQQWTDAWDSRMQGALPVAVEVVLRVNLQSESRIPRVARTNEPPSPVTSVMDLTELDPVTADMLLEEAGPTGRNLPTYRFVIHLPQAAVRQSQGFSPSVPASPEASERTEPDFSADMGP